MNPSRAAFQSARELAHASAAASVAKRFGKVPPVAPQRREGHRDRGPENLCALPASAVHQRTGGFPSGPVTRGAVLDCGSPLPFF